MRDTITIGDKDVTLAATAATPFLFKKIFGRDFLKESQEDATNTELYIMLGFVMTQDPNEILKGGVKERDFFDWLSQFDYIDIINALPSIVNLYASQKKGASIPKNPAD